MSGLSLNILEFVKFGYKNKTFNHVRKADLYTWSYCENIEPILKIRLTHVCNQEVFVFNDLLFNMIMQVLNWGDLFFLIGLLYYNKSIFIILFYGMKEKMHKKVCVLYTKSNYSVRIHWFYDSASELCILSNCMYLYTKVNFSINN